VHATVAPTSIVHATAPLLHPQASCTPLRHCYTHKHRARHCATVTPTSIVHATAPLLHPQASCTPLRHCYTHKHRARHCTTDTPTSIVHATVPQYARRCASVAPTSIVQKIKGALRSSYVAVNQNECKWLRTTCCFCGSLSMFFKKV